MADPRWKGCCGINDDAPGGHPLYCRCVCHQEKFRYEVQLWSSRNEAYLTVARTEVVSDAAAKRFAQKVIDETGKDWDRFRLVKNITGFHWKTIAEWSFLT